MSTRQARFRQRQQALRDSLFSDVPADQLWDRTKTDGFATIPRAFPIILTLMDELSPSKPIGKAYLALWCRGWDDPLAEIGSDLLEIALESGFTGPRAKNSLCARLAILQDLGFVRFAEGSGGRYTFALVLNPYRGLGRHKKRLSKMGWNTLRARMIKIGANDLDTEIPTLPPPPPPPSR